MRRVAQDALISVAALAVLLLCLVSIDVRVREHVERVVNGATPASFGGDQLSAIGSMVFVAARDQSVAHAPLAIFVAAATLLLVALLRT